jgi:hypothetical protein
LLNLADNPALAGFVVFSWSRKTASWKEEKNSLKEKERKRKSDGDGFFILSTS